MQFIATQLILDLREETGRTPGARAEIRWWYQSGIYLTGERERAAAAADEDGGEQ